MKQLKKNLRYIIKSGEYSSLVKFYAQYTFDSPNDLFFIETLSKLSLISIDWLVRKDISKKTRKQMRENYYKIQRKLTSNAK